MKAIFHIFIVLISWKSCSGLTEIRRPNFVWKDTIFSVTCAKIPSLPDSTMVLMRSGKNVEELGFALTLLRGAMQPVTQVTSDQLIATKNSSDFIDADYYECFTCYGNGHTDCPDGAESVETATDSVLVGKFEPDVQNFYVPVPNGFNLTLVFTGPGNMSSVTWLQYGYDVSRHGFTKDHGFFEKDGFTMEYYTMVAERTIFQNRGQYQLSFRRRITEDVRPDVSSMERFISVITYGMNVTGPVSVSVGSDTTLRCQIVDPNARMLDQQFAWEFHGQPIEENADLVNRISTTSGNHSSILTITSSDWKVAGEYTCVYSFTSQEGRSETLRESVEVRGEPHVGGIEGDTSYDSEDSLSLRCVVGGYPAPTVTWHKDGHEIVASSNIRIISNPEIMDYRLIVENLKTTDKGNYSCRAKISDIEEYATVEVGVEASETKMNRTYLIIGLVVGICILLIIIVCCCVGCYKRRDKDQKEEI